MDLTAERQPFQIPFSCSGQVGEEVSGIDSEIRKEKKAQKNPKRQAAGKRNFLKLARWNAEVKEAFKILKETGYKGTFTLRKGKPMYELILKLRKEKLEATSA